MELEPVAFVRQGTGWQAARDGRAGERTGGLRDLTSLKPADVAVKEIEFPDITDPKPKPGDTGIDPKVSLPNHGTIAVPSNRGRESILTVISSFSPPAFWWRLVS